MLRANAEPAAFGQRVGGMADRLFMCQLGGIQGGNEGGEVTSEFEKSRENTTTVETTPEGLIESGYRQVQAALASDLLERVKAAPPAFFERLVVKLLVAMGYGGSIEGCGKGPPETGSRGDRQHH